MPIPAGLGARPPNQRTAAFAAQSYTDTVSGHEYYATSTDGKFAGTATGSLPGTWNADVQHTTLCISCSTTATITGGSFIMIATSEPFPLEINEEGYTPPFAYTWVGEGTIEFSKGK